MAQKPPSLKERVQAFVRPERTQEAFSRLHKEAGLIPLLNLDDTEARRQEIKTILKDCEADLFDQKKQREVVRKDYGLYFSAGNPWYRGLDNRELAEKVECFLENYTEVAYMDEFIPDLFEEAQQLLSLSWQALDVTNTPATFIESRPIIDMKGSRGSPEAMLDSTGLAEMQEEIERLKQESKKK
jgi:hypothetical protein